MIFIEFFKVNYDLMGAAALRCLCMGLPLFAYIEMTITHTSHM